MGVAFMFHATFLFKTYHSFSSNYVDVKTDSLI